MKKTPTKSSPLYVELPEDLRDWLIKKAEEDGHTIKEKTIRILKQARQLEAMKVA